MPSTAEVLKLADEDLLRADLYDFLGTILSRPPDQPLLHKTAALSGDKSDMGQAIGALSRLAKTATPQSAEREFSALFIGFSRGELLPYASYYLTGFLNEKPLAALRGRMRRLGIARAEDVFEPEDGIASLCEMMSGVIRGRFGAGTIDEQSEFFNEQLRPWAGLFFKDLEAAKNSVLYAPVGTVGRLFLEIEKEAFRLSG